MLKKFKNLSDYARTSVSTYGIVLLAFAVIFPLQQAGMLSYSLSGMLVPICAYIVMAISLNLTVGVLGELSLGHAGFMSVGAFSGAVAAAAMSESIAAAPIRLAIAMIIGAAIAGVAGVLIGIPVLRLKGDYLAIVTLACGEITKQDLVELGLSGGPNAAQLRLKLLKKLDLPEHMSANALLQALNLLYSLEELKSIL